jgi:hypothetical protein
MSIILTLINGVNEIPVKIQAGLFIQMESYENAKNAE